MKIADLFADRNVLHIAGVEVEKLLKDDPKLQDAENQGLKNEIKLLYTKLNSN